MERGAAATVGRGRRIAAVALATLGALALVVGMVLLYARDEIFDADSFADHAVAALHDERTQDALAEPITDVIIDQGPDVLVNARPIIISAVHGVVGSKPFRDVFREGVARAHRTLFNRDRDKLVLNLADAGALAIHALRTISPRTADKLPRGVEGATVAITESKFAISAVRIAESVRVGGVVLPIIAVLLLAGAVAAAPDRRRGLVTVAAAVTVAVAVALIALLIGRGVVIGRFEDDVVADAVRAVWDAFLGGLRNWLLAVGGLAVIAVAALELGRPADLAAPARRLVDRLRRPPSTTAGRVARSLGVFALSLFGILRPDLAISIAVVALGALGLLFAVSELLALIAPPPKRGQRASVRERIRPRRALIAAGVVAGVAVVVLVIAIGGGNRGRPGGPIEACNGYAALCDRPLDQVVFAASHNSMSAASEPGWFTPDQKTGIPEQLDRGIRALLIDPHYGIRTSSGVVLTDLAREDRNKINENVAEKLGGAALDRVHGIVSRLAGAGQEGKRGVYLCHTACELGATEMTKAMVDVREFLAAHPDEFVILFLEDYVKPTDIERVFEDAGLVRYAYTPDPARPPPTLRELIRRDKRILVLAENDNGGGRIPWYLDGFSLVQETPYEFHTVEQLSDYAYACEPNRGDPGNPYFQINHFVTKLPVSPDRAARANAYDVLLPRAQRCARIRGLVPNIVGVDFYEEGDLFDVVRRLNGLPRDEQAHVRVVR